MIIMSVFIERSCTLTFIFIGVLCRDFLLVFCSLLQHLLNTSNSQTKSIYICFQPRVNSLPLKKSDRIWVEGGLTLVCSCPTMPVIMNHEVVENKRAHRQHCSVNSAQNMSLVHRTYNLTCFESVQSIFV